MILDENANEVESILRNITNNNTMDLTNYFEISDVQDISMELAMLTNTSDRPIVVNDLNTSNDVLSTLIRLVFIYSIFTNDVDICMPVLFSSVLL